MGPLEAFDFENRPRHWTKQKAEEEAEELQLKISNSWWLTSYFEAISWGTESSGKTDDKGHKTVQNANDVQENEHYHQIDSDESGS